MRQIDFLKSLEHLRFTGQLVQTDSAGQQWTIYLMQGKIAYATGLRHSVRRWRRNLITYCPGIPTYRLAWQIDLSKVSDEELVCGWEYALLRLWVAQQRLTQARAEHLIRSTITEVLLDAMQTHRVTNQLYRHPGPFPCLKLFEVEDMVAAAESCWQNWQRLGLTDYSPDSAPVIQQPDKFQHWAAMQADPPWIRLLNGQRSLRDLATEGRQDISTIALLLSDCVRSGYVELASLSDLPGLVFQREPPKPLPNPAEPKALIACIDDSRMVRRMMEELLTSSGYQFLGIEDPLRAIGLLLSRKPQFIFLDLVMPNANGYEICEKLRKLSCFRHTPIVILTSNDGYANRLRSNFVGATDFLSKPLNAEAVLSMVSRHLSQVKSDLTV